MVYELFLETVRKSLQERLGDGCMVTLRQIPKNNGVFLDGLCLGKQMCPSQFDRFDTAKRNIAFKLIHAASNRELLEDVPYVPFYDLALVFYLFLDSDESCQMTALIHKTHQSVWKISTQELYRLAHINTPRLFPAVIRSIEDVLREIVPQNQDDDFKEENPEKKEGLIPLYVLTNKAGLHGACCILYDGVLKNFADQLGKDLVILPSSIHEVILLPKDENLCPQDLSHIVSEINQTEVSVEERLSNQIYLYTRDGNQIVTFPTSSEEV